MPKFPSRNYTLAIAVKKHAKVDIKLFLSYPILNILSGIAVLILVQTRNFTQLNWLSHTVSKNKGQTLRKHSILLKCKVSQSAFTCSISKVQMIRKKRDKDT